MRDYVSRNISMIASLHRDPYRFISLHSSFKNTSSSPPLLCNNQTIWNNTLAITRYTQLYRSTYCPFPCLYHLTQDLVAPSQIAVDVQPDYPDQVPSLVLSFNYFCNRNSCFTKSKIYISQRDARWKVGLFSHISSSVCEAWCYRDVMSCRIFPS